MTMVILYLPLRDPAKLDTLRRRLPNSLRSGFIASRDVMYIVCAAARAVNSEVAKMEVRMFVMLPLCEIYEETNDR